MSPVFTPFVDGPLQREPLRAAITAAYRTPESEAVAGLLVQARLPQPQAEAAQALSEKRARLEPVLAEAEAAAVEASSGAPLT